jgi:uncharacterized membrane protein YfcA
MHEFLAVPAGAVVGLILGLIGGGGSVLAVPLLVYAVGVPSPHVALGTSALGVSLSAAANLAQHARAGRVRWPCAAVFTPAGMLGAAEGSAVAQRVDGQRLLAAFGVLMLIVGAAMLRRRSAQGDPALRLSRANARQMAPRLFVAGLLVGSLSGFFGIGGGFLIVPALLAATGMTLQAAMATSLVAVCAFGATTACGYALAGMIDTGLAVRFLAGGLLGGLAGTALVGWLGDRTRPLALLFGGLVICTGLYVLWRVGTTIWLGQPSTA